MTKTTTTSPNGESPGGSITDSGKTVIVTVTIGPHRQDSFRYSIRYRRAPEPIPSTYESGTVNTREAAADRIIRAISFMATEGRLE